MLDDTQDTGARTNTTHHAGAGAYPSGIQGDGVHDNTHPPYPRDGARRTTTRDAGARTSGADADVRAAGGLDPAGVIVAQANEAPTAERPVEGVVQVLSPRQVPLGGLRALEVRRTLPHRDRSFVGAWCFVDHYGPERGVGMDVPPHPHTGLQTVSWLFEGAIEHHDSGGAHAVVRPGEVNLMTSGHGIVHSEVSTPGTETLHGVQLWVALPDVTRDGDRAFEHHGRDGDDDNDVLFLHDVNDIVAALGSQEDARRRRLGEAEEGAEEVEAEAEEGAEEVEAEAEEGEV